MVYKMYTTPTQMKTNGFKNVHLVLYSSNKNINIQLLKHRRVKNSCRNAQITWHKSFSRQFFLHYID